MINLTKSVALEVGKDRIRVNCICPGGINTPLIFNNIPGGYEAAGQFLKTLQPIQRAGLPEDIAAMALFLASDESQWITGTAMVVDGGFTAGRTFFASGGGDAGPIRVHGTGPKSRIARLARVERAQRSSRNGGRADGN